MARTVELTVYRFEELDERTQERVLDNFRASRDFPWADEWRDSLNAFAERAPITIRDWSIGYPGTFVSFHMDDEALGELSGVRAYKWLLNNGWVDLAAKQDCPFTGYCGDEALLDAIRTAIASPTKISSLYSVFQDALHDWAKAFEADMDYHYSDEAIREDIEANECEFHANGTLA